TGYFTGIGFALPSSLAVDVYNQLVTNGRVRRAFLGVKPQEMTPPIARLNKISDGSGVVVRELTGDTSPAPPAGLQTAAIILSINGQKVKTSRELIRRIASLPVGSLANVIYVRNGEQRATTVKLEEREEAKEPGINIRQLPFDSRHPRGFPEKENDGAKPKPK